MACRRPLAAPRSVLAHWVSVTHTRERLAEQTFLARLLREPVGIPIEFAAV